MRARSILGSLVTLLLGVLCASDALAWDSPGHPPGFQRPTHQLLTRFAVDKVRKTQPGYWHLNLQAVRDAVAYGSNVEAHYPDKYPYGGNNWGCADPDGWWREALKAKPTDIEKAYRKLGIMLHMVQDMGVPAHACHVLHGVELGDGIIHPDRFEWMATYNWKPNYAVSAPRLEFNGTCTGDPKYAQPSDYYRFCQNWTLYDLANEPPIHEGRTWFGSYWKPPGDPANEDPNNIGSYPSGIDIFNVAWAIAFEQERCLVSKRQNRTAWTTYWALLRACELLHQPLPPTVTLQPGAPRDDEDIQCQATGSEYSGFTGILSYAHQWSRSRDGGQTWSSWGWAGATLSRNVTAPWDMWKARARAADPQGNVGDWAESEPVTIIPRVDEDGDPIRNVWFAHVHAKPPGWTAQQWQAHLNAADGRSWKTAFHLLNPAAVAMAAGDVLILGRGAYPAGFPDPPVFPGVTLRSTVPTDAQTRAATRLPVVRMHGPRSKVRGLTFDQVSLHGPSTVCDTNGTVELSGYDRDTTLLVQEHRGKVYVTPGNAWTLDVRITQSLLSIVRVNGWGSGNCSLRIDRNTVTGQGVAISTTVDAPAIVTATIADNMLTGCGISVHIGRHASPYDIAGCTVVVSGNDITRGGIRCVGSIGGNMPTRVINNTIARAPAEGLWLSYLGPLTVSGNRITKAIGRGIHLEFCEPVGKPVQVLDNEIRQCTGGGLDALRTWAQVRRNVIAENETATGGGGGIAMGSSMEASDNQILSNRAPVGGGVALGGDIGNEGILRQNVIRGNTATDAGGGVFARSDGVRCEHNLIEQNTADLGGGIYVRGIGTVSHNVIRENRALSRGGGFFLEWSADGWHGPSNNIVAANTAMFGGGACFGDGGDSPPENTFITFGGNTLVCNQATNGGGIHVSTLQPHAAQYRAVVRNCILTNSRGGGGIQVGPSGSLDLQYSNVFANVGGNYLGVPDPTGQNGNLSVNPRYADLAGGDYHLMSKTGRWSPATQTWVKDTVHSPCIDAGDLASPFDQEPTPNGGRVNMGAYGNTPEASKSSGTASAGTLTVAATAVPTAAGGAQVVVRLATEATVEIRVLNLAGRVVSVLPTRDLASGANTLVWDGRSVTGTHVPAGRYLVQVTARTADGQQQQALAAVSLGR